MFHFKNVSNIKLGLNWLLLHRVFECTKINLELRKKSRDSSKWLIFCDNLEKTALRIVGMFISSFHNPKETTLSDIPGLSYSQSDSKTTNNKRTLSEQCSGRGSSILFRKKIQTFFFRTRCQSNNPFLWRQSGNLIQNFDRFENSTNKSLIFKLTNRRPGFRSEWFGNEYF